MPTNRFTGTVEPLAPVDVAPLVEWISSIDFRDWPQQNPPGGELKPAMVTDPHWHDFAAKIWPVVYELMEHFPRARASNRMLSVVMPGDSIPPHQDELGSDWLCRIHVPLLSNDHSRFIVRSGAFGGIGTAYRMEPGTAYRVNVQRLHQVSNNGTTPRIHFMFDVGQ